MSKTATKNKETKNCVNSLRPKMNERDVKRPDLLYTPPSTPSSMQGRRSSLASRNQNHRSMTPSSSQSFDYQINEKASYETTIHQQPYLSNGRWCHSSTPPMSDDGATYNTPGGPRREKTRGLVVKGLPTELLEHHSIRELREENEKLLKTKFEGVRGTPVQTVYFFVDTKTGMPNGYASVLFYSVKDAYDVQWRAEQHPWEWSTTWERANVIVEFDQRDLAKGPDVPKPIFSQENSVIVENVPRSMNHIDIAGCFGAHSVAKAVVLKGGNESEPDWAVIVFHLEASAERVVERWKADRYMGRREEQRKIVVKANRAYAVNGWADGDRDLFLALNPNARPV